MVRVQIRNIYQDDKNIKIIEDPNTANYHGSIYDDNILNDIDGRHLHSK